MIAETPIRPMIEHMSIGVSDYSRSLAFYDGVLEPLGFVRVSSHDEPEGESACLGSAGGSTFAAGRAGSGAVLDPAPRGCHHASVRFPSLLHGT